MTNRAFIGIGSNLDDPLAQCQKAIEHLQSAPGCTFRKASSFYKTEPVGPAQGWFVNAVVEIETLIDPLRLLSILLHIEQEMGRIRREKWGPRLIDLDLLLYGNSVLNLSQLTLPHPEMIHRRFVLEPLAEIAPSLKHPQCNQTIEELLSALPTVPRVERLDPSSGLT